MNWYLRYGVLNQETVGNSRLISGAGIVKVRFPTGPRLGGQDGPHPRAGAEAMAEAPPPPSPGGPHPPAPSPMGRRGGAVRRFYGAWRPGSVRCIGNIGSLLIDPRIIDISTPEWRSPLLAGEGLGVRSTVRTSPPPAPLSF